MNTLQYKLSTNQHISDLDIQINEDDYITHLSADTGTGKSSWVMNTLSKQYNIIFAVPQRAQIAQLQARFRQLTHIDFVYGGQRVLSDNPRLIVCTYDQLPWVQSKVFAYQFMLVIDEAHKLYQAASYRADAIANLLHAIEEERFASVITVSATFTPELVPFQIDTWLTIDNAKTTTRELELRLYNDVLAMEKDLLKRLSQQNSAPTVARINNKHEIHAFKDQLEEKGIKCLAVSRDLQTTESVAQMLTAETIAPYDVVLTTSLLDEAININDAHIHEVIVYNSQIHPEELKQFVGRFRHDNPAIKLYTPRYLIGSETRELNAVKQSQFIIAKAAQQLAEVIQLDHDVMQAVRKANTTLLELFKFEPLRIHQSRIVANEPAIMASLYQADTALCYRSVESLERAFQDELGRLAFTITEDVHYGSASTCAPPGSSAIDNWYEALLRCKQAVDQKVTQLPAESHDTTDMPTLIERTSKNFAEESLEHGILLRWARLNQEIIADADQAFDVIEKDREKKVWKFHYAADSNLYIQPILKHLNTLPRGTVMTLDEARRCVLQALKDISKRYPPFKEAVAAAHVPGITVKRNNHFAVTDRFVRSIFRDYTATPPKRSNNKDKIVFDGIGPYGYKYHLKSIKDPAPAPRKAIRRIRRVTPKA